MCVGNLFGGGSTPTPPPAPTPIPAPIDTTAANAQASQASSDNAKKALAAQGLQSTINTGPLGVTTPANINKPSLLGYSSQG